MDFKVLYQHFCNTAATDGTYCLQFSNNAWRCPEIQRTWESLIEKCENSDAVYQSTQFFDNLQSTQKGQNLSLVTVSNGSGMLVGVIPLRITYQSLEFGAAGHVFGESRLRAVTILGSQPLIPADPVLHNSLFTMLSGAFHDCDVIHFPTVPTDGFLWRHIHESREIRRHFFVYVPYGRRLCNTIPLPATFEEYLKKFSSKKRYNLKRQVRLLQKHTNGVIKLHRIELYNDVQLLVTAINKLIVPHLRDKALDSIMTFNEYAALTKHNLLLCYLLISGDQICALTLGMRFRDTYLLHRTAYESSLERFSPGTTLLHLLVEDLISDHLVKRIELGYGEPVYSHRSTNLIFERGTVLLIRKTITNRLRILSHSTFHSILKLLKQTRAVI